MAMDEIMMAVNSDVSVPLNEGGVKIVKSVQKGQSTGNNVAITISEVDPDKCLVLLNGLLAYTGGSNGYVPVFSSLTSTTLNILPNYTSDNIGAFNSRWSWQVIELY